MPGLFDNSSNPITGILGGIGAALNPEYAMQKRGLNATYNALKSSGFSDDEATAATLNPQAAQEIWQRKIFQQQFESLRNSPGPDGKTPLGDAAAYGILTNPEAAKAYYGYQYLNNGPELGGGVHLPGQVVHGGGIMSNGPAAGPQIAGQQSQPSQQPAALQPQPQGPQAPPGYEQYQPLVDYASRIAAQRAAETKAAEQTATAQPDLPVLQTRAQTLIAKLQGIRDNDELPNVVGGPLGIKGRTGPLGQKQSDLVNDIQDANNALQSDLFTSMRSVSGRGISPGALKEMRITDLQGGRTGTVAGYKDNINKTIKQIQDEYGAAWEARGHPDAYKPNWAQSQQAPQFHEGQTAINRQTGQRITYTNGRWQ